MPESCRRAFVYRSVFGRSGPYFAENSPTHEKAPPKTGHSGQDFMIPETSRRGCRKLSATVVRPGQTDRPIGRSTPDEGIRRSGVEAETKSLCFKPELRPTPRSRNPPASPPPDLRETSLETALISGREPAKPANCDPIIEPESSRPRHPALSRQEAAVVSRPSSSPSALRER